jgi:transketolase
VVLCDDDELMLVLHGLDDRRLVERLDREQAVPQIAAHKGTVYMRLARGNVPLVLDEYDYRFELGKAKLLRDGEDVLVISSGFMTMRSLEVAQTLRADNVGVAVLHCPTIVMESNSDARTRRRKREPVRDDISDSCWRCRCSIKPP